MSITPTPPGDWLAVAPVALPIAVGAALLMLRRRTEWQAPVAIAALVLVAICTAGLLLRVLDQGAVVMTMGQWLPPFGISFTVDLLGAAFAMTASMVALCCAAAARSRIDAVQRRYGFFSFLLLTTAGVNGAFLTGDIFNLYVWFEVFLISSFGLLVIGSTRAQLDGTLKYAVLNLIATTLFLIATAYLYGIFGTLNMADIARKVPAAETAPLMTLASLYLLAFGMKAAAFPVHAWLPASYHTPNIITSAFFGGVLTKVGVYALMRSLVLLFPSQLAALQPAVGAAAAATMLFGVLGALAQDDIRRMFGFLVISGVGVMLAGLAVTPALGGAIFYALHSMVAISAAYLLAGAMAAMAGTSSLSKLGGLYTRAPWLSLLAFILLLAICGLPGGSGLWPKVMIVQAGLAGGTGWQAWLAGAVLLSSLLTILVMGRFFLLAFWRPAPAAAADGVRSSGTFLITLLLLVTLAMGLYPEPFMALSLDAARGLVDPQAYIGAVFPGGPS